MDEVGNRPVYLTLNIKLGKAENKTRLVTIDSIFVIHT